MRRIRLADWLEKMSVALCAGSLLASEYGFWTFMCGIACLAISMGLTEKGD